MVLPPPRWPWRSILPALLLLTWTAGVDAGSPAVYARIPGFERFHTGTSAIPAEGGLLLLGELNCTSCHRPSSGQEVALTRKQAPILDGIGQRVQHAYFQRFLLDPQAAKPGTAMPNVLASLPLEERKQRAAELAHFLASTGTPRFDPLQIKRINAGRDLYGKVGCVACHGTRTGNGQQGQLAPTSVPLGDLTQKYTPASLAAFLENPHATRPSGRMPGLLSAKESREIADFLMQGLPAVKPAVNVAFAYYEGTWGNVPDFSQLKPKLQGEAGGFDAGVRTRENNFAIKFESYLKVVKDGNYKFWLTSDDGSKLWVDDKLVVNNDGVHPPQTVNASTRLEKGVHKVTVGLFQAGGGVELGVEVQGPGVGKQTLSQLVTLTPTGNPKQEKPRESKYAPLEIDAGLAAKGRVAFTTLGCASCHQLKEQGKLLESTVKAPELLKVHRGGCIGETPAKNAPHYALSAAQRKALEAGLSLAWTGSNKPLPPDRISKQTMTALNCYACHVRDKVGGIEEVWNKSFTTTQQEMGEEGRVPPELTGVGAKLKPEALQGIIANGTSYRPYMHTHMPRFGEAAGKTLGEAFAALDKLPAVPAVTFGQTPTQVKSVARHMVGGLSLGCIKCHTFAGKKAEGVQGIDMTVMAGRLNRDWFHRYLLDPNKFRPGTRMPTSWPQGQSLLPTILDGDTSKQIEAIWVYLNDGPKAALPLGLGKSFIPLTPVSEPIIYRNFIAGGGPRAIGVGYPEKVHLVFDANEMRYPLFWQGAFMDASRHWTDRGVGYEPPLGDNLLKLPGGPGFSFLSSAEAAWPQKGSKEVGYHFKGYRLDARQRPAFLYRYQDVSIEDFPQATEAKPHPGFRRTLTLSTTGPVENLYFRAMVGSKITPQDKGAYRINDEWTLRIEADTTPILRESNGQKELLVPVRFKDGRATIVQEFNW